MTEMRALLERWRMDEAEVRDGCTEHRRHGSESGGTRYGCWRRVGRQRQWRRRWNETPILLAYWPGHSQRVAPRRWFLNRVVVPPALDGERRAELKAAVQGSPSQAGIDLSNWNWKVVRQFVEERFRLTLSRSSCLNYPRLHGGRLCTGWGLC